MNNEIEVLIVEILKKELSLSNDNIWVDSENRVFPKVDDLLITVGMVDSQIISNKQYVTYSGEPVVGTEHFETENKENIQIDLISKNGDARQRRNEVVMALQSVYSQQVQEANQFKIFKIPSSFVNVSNAEGGSQLNRFAIVISCHTWYKKTQTLVSQSGYADYYETFPVRVDDEDTAGETDGLIEFTN